MIIAAGRGSRLQNETDELSKTLVEIMGKPMLDWNTALLALSVLAQNRRAESHTIAAPLCSAPDALDLRTRQTLEITHLCK